MNCIKKYLPKELNEIKNNENIIKDLMKINEKNLYNFIISGDYGTGKSLIKKLYLKNLNKKNIKIFELNLYEDLKKNIKIKEKITNILKIVQTKILIIDNYEKLKTEEQFFLKSLIKKKKNLFIFIFINNIDNLIEHFHSLFIIFKLKKLNYNEKYKYIDNILNKENIKIDKNIIMNMTENSSNYYDLNKNISYILNYRNHNFDYKIFNNFNNFHNKKKILKILKFCKNKEIYKIIEYIDYLINDGYSINNILNFFINEILLIKEIEYMEIIKITKNILYNEIHTENNNYTYNQLLSFLSKLCI
jgi:DNA polymerase III gamma/tau subunit